MHASIVDRRAWALSTLLAALVAVAVAALAERAIDEQGARLATVAHGVALALMLITTGLLQAHRRATGRALGQRLMVAVAALEGSAILALVMASVEPGGLPASLEEGLVRSVLTTMAAISLLWALRGPEIDLRGWVPRTAPLALLLVALSVTTLALPTATAVAATEAGTDHLVSALAWLMVGAVGWKHVRSSQEPLGSASLCAAALASGAELVRLGETFGLVTPAASAPMLGAAAVTMMLAGASVALTYSAIHQRSERHARDITGQLASDAAAGHRRRDAHEVRNALLAVEAVSERLESSQSLEGADRELLGAAIRDGVDHLRALLQAQQGSKRTIGSSLVPSGAEGVLWGMAQVDDVARRAVVLARARGLKIDLDVEPASSRISPTALRQGIDNLLINVERHARPTARCSVIVRRAGDNVEVVVDDDGSGVPRALRDHLLMPGAKADPEGPGDGLGLAVVADIVHAAGGSVELGRSPWGGLRATLRLPVEREGRAGPDRADPGQNRGEVNELLSTGVARRAAQEAATS